MWYNAVMENKIGENKNRLVQLGLSEALAEIIKDEYGDIKLTELTERAIEQAVNYGQNMRSRPTDVELLSTLLSLIAPKIDGKKTAERIVSEFGSLMAALAAGDEALDRFSLGRGIAMRLGMLARIILFDGDAAVTLNTPLAAAYYLDDMYGSKEPTALALDCRYRLVAKTDDKLDCEHVVGFARGVGARYIILSRHDEVFGLKKQAKEIAEELLTCGTVLLDYFVFNGSGYATLGASAHGGRNPTFGYNAYNDVIRF